MLPRKGATHKLDGGPIYGLTRQRQRSLSHLSSVVPDLKVERQPVGLVHAYIDQIEGIVAGRTLRRGRLTGQQEAPGIDVGSQPCRQRRGTRLQDERLSPTGRMNIILEGRPEIAVAAGKASKARVVELYRPD